MAEKEDMVLLTSRITWAWRDSIFTGAHINETENCADCEHNIPVVDDEKGSKRVVRSCQYDRSWKRLRTVTRRNRCLKLQRNPELPLDQVQAVMIPISEVGLIMPEQQVIRPPTQSDMFSKKK